MNKLEIKKNRIILDLREMQERLSQENEKKIEKIISDLEKIYLYDYYEENED